MLYKNKNKKHLLLLVDNINRKLVDASIVGRLLGLLESKLQLHCIVLNIY